MTPKEVLAWYEEGLRLWREEMARHEHGSREWWRARCCEVQFKGCVRRLRAGEPEEEWWPRLWENEGAPQGLRSLPAGSP